MKFAPMGIEPFYLQSVDKSLSLSIISIMKAKKNASKRMSGFLAAITVDEHQITTLEDTNIIWKFPEVFPDDIAGLISDRKIV